MTMNRGPSEAIRARVARWWEFRQGNLPRSRTGVWVLLLSVLTLLGGCSRGTPHAKLTEEQSHQLMLDELSRVRADAAENSLYVSDRPLRELQQRLAQLPSTAEPRRRWPMLYQLGMLSLNQGKYDECLELLREAESLVPAVEAAFPAGLVNQFYLDTGVAYLRIAETQNCCQRNTPGSCILPIQGAAIHTVDEWSLRAAEYFTKTLQRTQPDDPMHRAAIWLMNVAYMTIGKYPDQVPPDYLIPPTALVSDQEFPAFPNVAAELGLNTYSLAGSAAADDFDSDGDIDLVVSSYDPAQTLKYFRNDGQGKFSDQSQASQLGDVMGGLNIIQADYDNDGHVDLLVLRGGWLAQAGRQPKSLLRNRGDGTFTDVTYRVGLAEVHLPTQTASWADYDLDGDLDLYIGVEVSDHVPADCQLFRQEADGRFQDVTQQAGLSNKAVTKGVIWGDFNHDRWPDLYVSNFGQPNRLFQNQGNGTFQDRAVESGVAEPLHSFPTWFWDVNNDGHLDLFVAAYSGGLNEVAAAALGQEFSREATLPRLYLGDGQGQWQNAGLEYHLTKPHHPMGSNFGDLDNDGWLDFYLGTGWPEIREILPNALYRNVEGKYFNDISTVAGVAHLQKGHGVVFADFDHDGDLDLFEQMGGFVPCDRYYDTFYRNPGNSYHALSVQLQGRDSNRSAIGARICVCLGDGPEARKIYRHVNSGGTFGGNPLRQHLGLGDWSEPVRLEIFWPRSGKTQVVSNVRSGGVISIVEGEAETKWRPFTP